ncbi:leucine-rich repeat and guanylate kinase domain-containing protein isoform X2 [Denticeps clupeoides]|uniref:leucine-rich repeat and guanylate kinase domain-containing protein isoform X2 n=1 Tax=Denticeps clupeoides TaxID=299321 RepID=UPI0010A352DB|nr:leucine-rich repeat and guanylate kinase domain-containing protein isoform X2 [Denticeps clupeoides]
MTSVAISPSNSVQPEPDRQRVEHKADGDLTEEAVSDSLSDLGVSAAGLQLVFRALSVPGRNLNNISLLCRYVHLQKLELPHNRIKDLSCVSHMPYLITLDASHNCLSDFFGFQPPKNLKEVNLSYNQISEMKDLSAYSSLGRLVLDHNSVRRIHGLQSCISLTHLSLAHNKIARIHGLENLPLRELCLSGNMIEKIENLGTLRALQSLDLSSNRIHSLCGLNNLPLLGSINLESNLISEIKEASPIHDLYLLRDLNLRGNPVQDQPDYRLAIIFLLQQLTSLDQQPATAEEKVSAVNMYDPPLEEAAARDHMTQVLYQTLQPQGILDSTMPGLDAPYPMLVLTGPRACGKRELAHRLCQEFTEFFAYGACHTTREPYSGEEDGPDYHFITEEQFQNMIHMGKFIQTMQYGGHWFGLSWEAVESVAREGLACCVHMELEGVLSLKKSRFEPRYVLLIPTSTESYTHCLRHRQLYTQAEMQLDAAVSRIDLYGRVNRERPGFFDIVIPSDDRAQAYAVLRQAVMEYLNLEESRGGDSSPATPACSSNNMTCDSALSEKRKGVTLKAPPTTEAEADSYSRNYWNKVQAEITLQKSPAETASINRRQQMIRDALMGKPSPRASSRGVYTAPSRLTHQSAGHNLPGATEDSSLPRRSAPPRPAPGLSHLGRCPGTHKFRFMSSSTLRASAERRSPGGWEGPARLRRRRCAALWH